MAPYILTVNYGKGKMKSYVFPGTSAYQFAERMRAKGYTVIIEKIRTEVTEY